MNNLISNYRVISASAQDKLAELVVQQLEKHDDSGYWQLVGGLVVAVNPIDGSRQFYQSVQKIKYLTAKELHGE